MQNEEVGEMNKLNAAIGNTVTIELIGKLVGYDAVFDKAQVEIADDQIISVPPECVTKLDEPRETQVLRG